MTKSKERKQLENMRIQGQIIEFIRKLISPSRWIYITEQTDRFENSTCGSTKHNYLPNSK